jgi:uncharacterized protein (TIGR02453 family)
MQYFTKEFLQFFKELEQNNNRDWFNENKKTFKELVEKPWVNFVEAVIDQVSAIDPTIKMTAKEGVFRIYKDTRFSKDKTPYKTQMSAVIAEGGRKGKKAGGIYLEASADSFKIYSGFYMPDRKDLQKVREAIVSDLAGFAEILAAADFKEKFGEMQGEKNKRIPKEFKEDAQRQPLIFNKSFYVFNELPAKILLQENLLDIVTTHFQIAKPLSDFFLKAIKG